MERPETTTAQANVPAVAIREVSKRYAGTPVLDGVSLDIRAGEFLALLGGSGCGKTTLLRCIAGLEIPDLGRIEIGGQDLTLAPAYARPVNMMFQSYALFPHLSVADNIAYGLRAVGVPAAQRERLVAWALALVRLDTLGHRRPAHLSGGQRQRVALARCLVKKPDVLLLDEPMAALDRNLREDMQRELVRIQREVGMTFVLVTHDQDEAMSMADRIAVMAEGRIVQCGAPTEIYARPASRFVARFLGRVNLFDGIYAVDAAGTATLTMAPGRVLQVLPTSCIETGAACAGAVRPEHVTLGAATACRGNEFPGTVEDLAYFGDITRVIVRLDDQSLVEATRVNDTSNHETGLARGSRVNVAFAPDDVVVLGE